MQQLMYGYTLYCNEFKPKEPVQVTNQLDRYALVKHHEKFLVILAKILMFCEKFAELSFNDKVCSFFFFSIFVVHPFQNILENLL